MSNHESYDNFDIMTNCIVEEILMTAKNKACGISYRNRLGAETGEILAERVIVAAGAIESAKLLLRSKSGDWTYGLGNYVADGFVGRNFVFHPYFMFQGTMASNPLLLQPEMDFPTFCSRHFDTEAEQAKGKFILVNPPGPSSVKLADMLTKGQTKDQINQQLRGTTVVQLHGMVEFFSQSANRVSNCLKRNHLGLTETQVICNADEGVKERIVDIEEVVGKIFDGMGVSNLSLNTYSWRADHAASVCRMGRDESEGVVDKDLKIFGVDNVYVLSNAVFPSIGCVNPTLTLTALAIRLGRHLTKPGKVRGEEIALGAKQ
jgi:choline dehydrogenase-like flavoprotein